MRRSLLLLLFAILAGLALAAQASVEETVMLEWKGTTYRVGGPIPIRMGTRLEPLSTRLTGAHLVVKGSDGRERRMRTSAGETKPKMDGGVWWAEADAGEMAETPPPGKFELTYEYEDGKRTKPLYGTLVAPIANPVDRLAKEPTKVAVLFETDQGSLLIGLRPDKAPKTVANFVKLVSDGFYDGKVFHRIKRGVIAQGGSYRPDGTASSSSPIPGEFSDLSHERGVISMARLPADPNSGSCQFFFCLANHREAFDKQYAAFGKLLDGFDTLDRIALLPVMAGVDNEMSKPIQPPVIKKAIVVEKP